MFFLDFKHNLWYSLAFIIQPLVVALKYSYPFLQIAIFKNEILYFVLEFFHNLFDHYRSIAFHMLSIFIFTLSLNFSFIVDLAVVAEWTINVNKFQFAMNLLPNIFFGKLFLINSPLNEVFQNHDEFALSKCGC